MSWWSYWNALIEKNGYHFCDIPNYGKVPPSSLTLAYRVFLPVPGPASLPYSLIMLGRPLVKRRSVAITKFLILSMLTSAKLMTRLHCSWIFGRPLLILPDPCELPSPISLSCILSIMASSLSSPSESLLDPLYIFLNYWLHPISIFLGSCHIL